MIYLFTSFFQFAHIISLLLGAVLGHWLCDLVDGCKNMPILHPNKPEARLSII